jgi:hypothetical protein
MSLYEVIFGRRVEVIQWNAFVWCGLKHVRILHGVNLDYEFPGGCDIEYFDDIAAEKTEEP